MLNGVSSPKMAHVFGEFEAATDKKKKADTQDHEETKLIQKAFARDVSAY